MAAAMDNNNRSGGGSDGSCHYSVLGIRKEASLSDIRKAYRKLALRWHPDRLTKDPSVAGDVDCRRFQRIQEAYSVLSDEGKRSMYDAGTLDLFDEEEDDEGMGEFMHDLFKMMDKNNRDGAGAAGGEVRKEESLEDLQRCFMETFGADLASYLNTTTTTTVQDHQPSYNPNPHPKTTTRSHHTTPYARATPKTRPTTTTTYCSTSTTKN